MEIINKKLNELIPYINNPRKNDNAVDKVASSIKNFGFKVPVIIDSKGEIVAGHTRLKAAKKLNMEEIPCIVANDLTDSQIKAFRIADNRVAEESEWDMELLNIELQGIGEDFDIDDLGFDVGDLDFDIDAIGSTTKERSYSLAGKWLVPPFSVLDGRAGVWQDRKRAWLDKGIKSEIGRKDNLSGAPLSAEYVEGTCSHFAPSTSIFDPALCELAYMWFCTPKGKILDPFAGGSVRGIVASHLGFDYHGNDLSGEQVEANRQSAEELCTGCITPTWSIGDSKNIKELLPGQYDMIFSCPPYADLEVYSEDERDISNMEYKAFLSAYNLIISNSCEMLKNDRFAVFVIGEVRDKKGLYYNFVGDTIKCFIDAGMKYYNEIILVSPNGTAGMRADRSFGASRKIVKTHQNVLVFYKGDPKNIKGNYPELDLSYMDDVIGGETDGEENR